MTPVNINITPISQKFGFTRQQSDDFIEFVLQEITATFAYYLGEQAKNTLFATRAEYMKGIYVEDAGKHIKVVGLHGWLPNAVEQGCEPFDEKVGFGKSNKITMKKDGGWYITIPFRSAASGSTGDAAAFSGKLPESIHKVMLAKSKVGDTSSLKEAEIPTKYQIPATRPQVMVGSTVFKEYVNKSSIYTGLQKSEKSSHSQYVNFRRVSDLSDADSWIHTGIQARNLSKKALDDTLPKVGDILDNATEKFTG